MTDRPAAHGQIAEPTGYTPAWWLPGGHTQTLWGALRRRVPIIETRRERVELPDGDFVDLAHIGRDGGPLVLVLHGLEGNLQSSSIARMLAAIAAGGWHGVLMQFRGCSGEPNRLARSYHSGDTGDVAHVAELLKARANTPDFGAIGYSLGGNVLLKYLGEAGDAAPFTAAAAISVPFDLSIAADTLNRGFSRVYQRHLLESLKAKTRLKFARLTSPIDLTDLARWRDFRTYDDRVTAPLHGFLNAQDYYARSSSRPYLRRIAVPTLVIHALDDPFLAPHGIPTAPELAVSVRLELAQRGGHVGFVTADEGESGWLEERISAHVLAAFGAAGTRQASGQTVEWR